MENVAASTMKDQLAEVVVAVAHLSKEGRELKSERPEPSQSTYQTCSQ